MENGPFIDGLPTKNGAFPWQWEIIINLYLVGGFKHGFYFPSYMGCHPSH
jgi:hypothetical protein